MRQENFVTDMLILHCVISCNKMYNTGCDDTAVKDSASIAGEKHTEEKAGCTEQRRRAGWSHSSRHKEAVQLLVVHKSLLVGVWLHCTRQCHRLSIC